MIQLPFPSTIRAQPRNVTFLTIKTVVPKIQKNGLMCLDKAVLGQGGGGLCDLDTRFFPTRLHSCTF